MVKVPEGYDRTQEKTAQRMRSVCLAVLDDRYRDRERLSLAALSDWYRDRERLSLAVLDDRYRNRERLSLAALDALIQEVFVIDIFRDV